MIKSTMMSATLVLCVSLGTIAQAEEYPYRQPGPARDAAVREITASCIADGPKKAPNVDPQTLSVLCDSAGKAGADVITKGESDTGDRRGRMPDSLRVKLPQIVEICAKQVFP